MLTPLCVLSCVLLLFFIPERAKGRPMRDLLDFTKPEANEQMLEMFAAAGTGSERKWKDQLADEVHKPVKRKLKRRVIANGVDDIWSADLIDMQWSNRENRLFKYLLNVVDNLSKCFGVFLLRYAW